MEIENLCSICGAPTKQTCSLCGMPVCYAHISSKVCSNCRSGEIQ